MNKFIVFLLLFSRFNSNLAGTPPYIKLNEPLKSVINEYEENTVNLKCPIEGDPTPLIQWSINDIPLHELTFTDKRMVLNSGRILRIYDLNHDVDSGLYQCNGSNYFGHISKAFYLNVQAFAPQFTMAVQRVWKVIRNSEVYFSCDVKAAPAPLVNWVDANITAITTVPGKLEIFPNYTLLIHKVSNADEGYYYCDVSNKYGINRSMNKLQVYSSTYFTEVSLPKRSVVKAMNSIEFRCKAIADPRISINYLWTHNGKPINATPIMNDEYVSVLKLDNLRGHHSGQIDCVAVTDVDAKSSSFELIVHDIPKAPPLIKIDCNYNLLNRVLIVWKKPLDHSDSITHFLVEAMTGFRVNYWQTVYEERNVNRDLFKLILPLSPWVNYTFRVTAHNSYGSSPTSTTKTNVCQTPVDVPHKSPENVNVFGTEPGNLVIQWKIMEKYDWNAPELRYLIRFRRKRVYPKNNNNTHTTMNSSKKFNLKNEKEKNFKWREFFVEDPLINETIIRDQPIYNEYEVQVRAVNLVGYSALPPTIFTGFSGENLPEIAPKNLHLTGLSNFSTVNLAWDPVPKTSLHGYFKGYKVVYWLSAQPYFTDYIFTDNQTLIAQINGLEALKNYSAQVFVINSQYSSPPSNLIQFITPEGPPSKVHDMRVNAVGAQSIFATWQPPLHLNGNIRGYFITFENSTSGLIEETYVLHRQLYYLHEFLEPDSPYKVAIWAETNGGEGQKVIRALKTWKLRNPDPPIFTVHSSSPHSINVEWHPAGVSSIYKNITTRWRFSGTTFYIKYKKSGNKNWLNSEFVNLPFTTLKVKNLAENSVYVIIGVAKDSGNRGNFTESKPISFRTDSRHSFRPINSEKLIWFVTIVITFALALIIIALLCCFAERGLGNIAKNRFQKKCFQRYQNIYNKSSVDESAGSGSLGIGTEVAFLDETSNEHKHFLASSFKELTLSANAKKRIATKKKKTEKFLQKVILPQNSLTPPITPSQHKLMCSMLKHKTGQQRVKLPSPVPELEEPIIENLDLI